MTNKTGNKTNKAENKTNTQEIPRTTIEQIDEQFGKGAVMMLREHEHKHEWYYSTVLSFHNDMGQIVLYKIVHHCRVCGLLNIKKITYDN